MNGGFATMGIKHVQGVALAACLVALAPASARSVPYVRQVYSVAQANHDFSHIAISKTGTVWVLNASAGGKYHALYAFAPTGRLIGRYPATWNPMSSSAACWTARGPLSAAEMQSAVAQFQQCAVSNKRAVSIARPTGLAIDHSGNVWVVTDGQSSDLYEVSPDGSIIGNPASAGMNARGLTIAPNGYIWVVTEARPKVDADVPPPKRGSQPAVDRLWGGSTELRVYNDQGTLVAKVKYMDFNTSKVSGTTLKKTKDWHIFDNLVFTASGKYTNLTATLVTKHSQRTCTDCVVVGAAATEGRLVRDFDLADEPGDCDTGAVPGQPGGDGSGGLRHGAFAPNGLLWRSWDLGLFAVDLKHGLVKRHICAKPFEMIGRFAISADGTIWAYSPREHGVIHFTAGGAIIRSFPGVTARDIAIDHDGNVWAVAAGRVVEIVGASRKPPYFPYDFNVPNAPQWP